MSWDNQEFAAIFNEHYPGLCRFLECMMVGNGNAQDIAQETFVRLFRKDGGAIPAEEVRFWIYRVTRTILEPVKDCCWIAQTQTGGNATSETSFFWKSIS